MYPLNFEEYLSAMDLNLLLKELNQIPVKETAHNSLLDHFNRYTIVGGMHEIVATYKEKNNDKR